MNARAVNNFHGTRLGHLSFGVVELALCGFFINLAIPSGDWWEWLLGGVCFVGVIQNFGRMVVGAKK